MPKADLVRRINRGLSDGSTLVSGGGTVAVGGSVGNAHSVDFLHASSTPEPGKLFPLDGSSLFLDSVLPATIVRTSRQIISGAGLTGGGDLSADRTLAVGAGTLITVNANDVALSAGSAQYQFPMTGATPFTPAWTLLSSLAGAGLAWGSGVFDVGAGDGITVAANAVAVALSTAAGLQLAGTPKTLEMGAPSTATAASTNAVSAATHSHAVTATADGATSHSTLLKSGTSGELQLDYATLLSYLRTPLIDTASGNLTLQPAGDLYLDPTGNNVMLTSAVTIQADNWSSWVTGWGISYAGNADFRKIQADELHVKAFIADIEQALAGGQIISKSVAIIGLDFTVPTTTGTLTVEDLPGFPNTAVFVAGDVVRMRYIDRSGGGLVVADVWGTVSAYTDLAGGLQSWTFTRTSGTVGQIIYHGGLVLDYGVSGDGYVETTVLDVAGAPYQQIVTWATNPWTAGNLSVRTRVGNLDGIFGGVREFGLFAGYGVLDTSRYLRVSSEAVELHNVPLKLYAGGATPTIVLDGGLVAGAPVEPYIAVGATLPTGPLVNDGIWMGKDGATADYEFRVGSVSAGALVKGIHWDGASLNVRGNLIVGPGHGFVLESPSMVCAYDGPRPYATDFQVDLTGHLGQRGTIVGDVIGRPGMFGKALQTGGAATNLVNNPVLGGTYASGLAPSLTESDAGGTITPTENADMAYIEYGTKSQKLVFAGNASDYVSFDHAAMANSTTYTWYLRFYLAAGSVNITSTRGTGVNLETFSTLGWNTYCYTVATAASGSNFTYFVRSPSGCTVYLTRCQIVAAAYNHPLISGDLPGHTWGGTAYASTSARAASYVTYPIGDVIKNARKGSIGMWVYCEGFNANGGVLWQVGNANAELDSYISSTGVISLRVNGVSCTKSTVTARTWTHIVATWDCDTNEMYVYMDGSPGTVGEPTTTTPTLHATVFGVGYSAHIGVNYIHPGYICDFFVTEAVLTADQIVQIYESGLPVVATRNPMSLLLTGTGRGKVEGSAGGIFAQDSAGKPTWALLNEATTVNGEALGIGDVLLGDNTASKANLLWDQSAGKLLFRGGTTMQVEIGTDGKLSAGGGLVLLSTAGIAITSGTDAYNSIAAYAFESGGDRVAEWFSYVTSSWHYEQMDSYSLSGKGTSLIISTHCPSDKESTLYLTVGRSAGVVASIEMRTNDSGEIALYATQLGFYDKSPINRPTGVAVTAAAIHAALVSLGLIAA